MILALEILAGIVLIVVAFVWGRKRRGPTQNDQASKTPARKTTDTKAFRQYAAGDIDHDTYREMLEQIQKDGK